ncbi:MAG: hypothetical protein CL534_07730 [Ahrensia sp.]|nr:hypothetical protein [Ahrensia sp.]
MRYYYRAPCSILKPYAGSFYLMEMPQPMSGQVRVEIPHIRFLCRGVSTLSVGDNRSVFRSPEVLMCGPSFRTGMVSVTENTLILGGSLTPAGWCALTGVSAEGYANRKVSFADIRPELDPSPLHGVIDNDVSDDVLFSAIERFLIDALIEKPAPRWDFINAAMDWATDRASPGISELHRRTGLSPRQVDRLCRYHFGASPKQVHRVFRALNIAYRLTVEGADNWREVVDPFYDQSHFVRDFKDRIGCTPGDFTGERLAMMRHDLEQKAAVADTPRYCLIG